MRRLAVAVAVAIGLAAPFLAAVSAQTPDDPGVYQGRRIADVMSYRGAGWLERATRIEEENPDALMAALPIEEGMLVVDIGCGSGYFARRMAAAVGPEGSVLCNDIQPEMLRIASELATREGVKNVSMVLGAEDDPKLPEGEVDLMLLVDVYHEFSEPEAMLDAMREALSPDGVIALAEFRLEGRTRCSHQARPPDVDRTGDEGVDPGWLRTRRTDRLAADPAPVPVPGRPIAAHRLVGIAADTDSRQAWSRSRSSAAFAGCSAARSYCSPGSFSRSKSCTVPFSKYSSSL